MLVTKKSTLTGKVHTMDLDITQEQLDRFEKRKDTGEYVQTIFPNLPKEHREFILSGITPSEWESIFGNE